MDDAEHLNLLNETNEVLVLDLGQAALFISDRLRNKIVPPEEGIYMKGSIDPICVKGKVYFTVDKNGDYQKIEVGNILDTSDEIYDANYNTVIEGSLARHKKRFYTDKTPDDANIIRVIRAICLSVVNEYTLKCSPKPSDMSIDHLIHPEYITEVLIKQEFDVELDRTCQKIVDFIGNYNWSIFTYKNVGRTFILERGMDFRIYDWYRIQYELSKKN